MTPKLSASQLWLRPRKTGLSLSVHFLAVIFALFPVMPVVWVTFTALKERGRVIPNPLSPPTELHWGNFPEAWQVGKFDGYFVNSLVVAVPTVIIILVFAILAAYAFARMNFRGKDALFIFFLVGLTIPMSVLVIPLFYEMRDLSLLSTPWALIFPQVAKQLPFAILLLYSFIRDLPGEILDAALIDGCNRRQLLTRIVVPLSTPAMVTLIVFSFMWSWNNFLLPIILIHEDAARTLPVGLNAFRGRFVTDIPMMMAGATITYLPVLLVYVIFQRQFIRGISAGALK
jgi:raffinose/stachyose/melibiose transport system permease protein